MATQQHWRDSMSPCALAVRCPILAWGLSHRTAGRDPSGSEHGAGGTDDVDAPGAFSVAAPVWRTGPSDDVSLQRVRRNRIAERW